MKITEIEQITEGPNDPHIFKAILTAGAPGAGKTTVAKEIQSGTGLKEVNIDKIVEYQLKKNAVDYDRAQELTSKELNLYLQGRLGLLIDGTGRNKSKIQEVKDFLTSLGYDSMMVFVNVSLETAKSRAVEREQVTGRKVDPDFLEAAYNQAQSNIGAFQSIFGNNFIVIDNEHDRDTVYLDRKVRQFLGAPPKNPEAYQWLKVSGHKRT